MEILLQEILQFIPRDVQLPLIIAGDFNMTPQSLLYQFMVEGSIETSNKREWYYSGQLEGYSSLKELTSYVEQSITVTTIPSAISSMEGLSEEQQEFKMGKKDIRDMEEAFIWEPIESPSKVSTAKSHQHSLEFCNVYDMQDQNQYSTTYHSKFHGIVDYIFYTKDHIRLRGFLQLAKTEDIVETIGPLPNILIPSDHLPLMCCFEFKP